MIRVVGLMRVSGEAILNGKKGMYAFIYIPQDKRESDEGAVVYFAYIFLV